MADIIAKNQKGLIFNIGSYGEVKWKLFETKFSWACIFKWLWLFCTTKKGLIFKSVVLTQWTPLKWDSHEQLKTCKSLTLHHLGDNIKYFDTVCVYNPVKTDNLYYFLQRVYVSAISITDIEVPLFKKVSSFISRTFQEDIYIIGIEQTIYSIEIKCLCILIWQLLNKEWLSTNSFLIKCGNIQMWKYWYN